MFFTIANKGYNEWWRYLVGLVLVFMGTLIGQIPLLIAIMVAGARKAGGLDPEVLEEVQTTADFTLLGIDKNLSLALIILAFAGGLLGLWFALRFIHDKSFRSIITPRSSIDWKKILTAFVLWFGLTLVFEGVNFILHPEVYELQFRAGPFLLLMLVAVFLLPLQTSFEELLFRGYLMQGFGLLFRNRWMPLLLTSLGFGFMHILNPEVEQYGFWVMLSYYVLAGLVMGLMTVWDDSTELALGVHAATNIYAAVVVTYEGSAIRTDAIWKSTDLNVDGSLIGFCIIAVLFLLIVSRLYDWDDPLRLFRPVEREMEEIADENSDWV